MAHNGASSRAGTRHHVGCVLSGWRVRVRFHRLGEPVEIAFFDRGPIDAKQLVTGGIGRPTGTTATSTARRSRAAWTLRPEAESVSIQNEIDAASLIRSTELNVQDQTKVSCRPPR